MPAQQLEVGLFQGHRNPERGRPHRVDSLPDHLATKGIQDQHNGDQHDHKKSQHHLEYTFHIAAS